MKRSDLAQFSVKSIPEQSAHPDGSKDYELTGIFNSLIDVGGEYWCWLIGDDRQHLIPQYTSFNHETREATFVLPKEPTAPIVRNYGHLNCRWQMYHVWMIEELQWKWNNVIFKASDAILHSYESEGETLPSWRKNAGGT